MPLNESLFESVFGRTVDQQKLAELERRVAATRGALADIQRELASIETAPIAAAGCNLAAQSIRHCRALASAGLRA